MVNSSISSNKSINRPKVLSTWKFFKLIFEVKNDDSDDEDGEEEEDADEQEDFEADLDLGDCLPQPKSDILEQYRLQMMNSATASSSHILRPTTPGQRKWVLTITNHYLLRE